MVNILVPTDFSDLSKVALQYAIKVANAMDGNVTLLHAISITQPTRASMRLKLNSLEEELVKYAKEDLETMVHETKDHVKTDHPIQLKVAMGDSFNITVLREAKKLRSGLIIMGTRGASGVKKWILGSNTTAVIAVSHIPVLVVPELAVFKSFTNVVYACDLEHIERELTVIAPYVDRFKSVIHLIHVTKNPNAVSAIEEKIDTIIQKLGYGNVIVRVLVNEDVDVALEKYVMTVKADLLTMFTHHRKFYQKLFDRSVTRKMAFHSKIPLLAFKQR